MKEARKATRSITDLRRAPYLTANAVGLESNSNSRPVRKPQVPELRAPALGLTETFDGPLVQRKSACACGGGCPRCLRSLRPHLEPDIGGDAEFEESPTSPVMAQRHAPASESLAVEPRHARREGHDLGSLCAPMERVFGSESSAVRVHRDGLADAHNARAVTIGEDIHLAGSEQDMTSPAGRDLVGHELTHVLQQRHRHGAPTSKSALESEADIGGTAAASGHRFAISGTASPGKPQRKPKIAVPPPSGSILYVGMNNADPEIKALQDRYKAGSPVGLTIIKGTTEETATDIGAGTTFDLSTVPGIEAFAKILTPDAANQDALKTIFLSQSAGDRDDLAHVAKVYSDTEADGKDRMTRVVLSGHSGGLGVFGHGGEVYFTAIVELAKVFPKAANQTKHLIVAGCHTGDEATILDYYVKAYPSLLTVWAWWDACPTGPGAAAAIAQWAGLTEHGQTKLPKQDSGIATWSEGVYTGSTSGKASPSAVLASIRTDDARFTDYFEGIRADPSPHGGWLEAYYGRVFAAARRLDVTGADHDEMDLKRQRALLLRYWKVVVKNFWVRNGAAIKTGYGKGSVPEYGSLSRKDALKAITDFPVVSTAPPAEQLAAQKLLDGLKSLDPKIVPDSMVAE
jgi:Domain of unknown function (DUF4157)